MDLFKEALRKAEEGQPAKEPSATPPPSIPPDESELPEDATTAREDVSQDFYTSPPEPSAEPTGAAAGVEEDQREGMDDFFRRAANIMRETETRRAHQEEFETRQREERRGEMITPVPETTYQPETPPPPFSSAPVGEDLGPPPEPPTPPPLNVEPEPEPVSPTAREPETSAVGDFFSEAPTAEAETEAEAEAEAETQTAEGVPSFLDFGPAVAPRPKRKYALGMPAIVAGLIIAVLATLLYVNRENIPRWLGREETLEPPVGQLADTGHIPEAPVDEGPSETAPAPDETAPGTEHETVAAAGSEEPAQEPVAGPGPVDVAMAGPDEARPSEQPGEREPMTEPAEAIPLTNEGGIPAREPKAPEVAKPPIERDPELAGLQLRTGNVHLRRGDFRKARAAYELATYFNPEDSTAWNNLGCALFRLRDYRLAERAFTQAMKLNTNYPESWYNLGCVYVEERNFKKAVQALRYAIAMDRTLVNEIYLDQDLLLLRDSPEFRLLMEYTY